MANSEQNSTPRPDDEAQDRFLRHYAVHQPKLRAYVGTFLPRLEDIDDVMQETAVVLWKKFDQLDSDDNFIPWARRVAYYEVCKFCRQNSGASIAYEAGVMEQIADTYATADSQQDDRKDALRHCMGTLRPEDRELIDLCYDGDESIKQVSAKIDRPSGAVYHSLGRIRRALLKCIQRTLAARDRQ